MTAALDPLSGTSAARLVWRLTAHEFNHVIPPNAPETALEEIKIAFAAWCSARPRSLFANLESAWNLFIAPKHGLPSAAVLLPGTPCPQCATRRYQREELQRIAYGDCGYCRGRGHLPPRAIPARRASAGTFDAIHHVDGTLSQSL